MPDSKMGRIERKLIYKVELLEGKNEKTVCEKICDTLFGKEARL